MTSYRKFQIVQTVEASRYDVIQKVLDSSTVEALKYDVIRTFQIDQTVEALKYDVIQKVLFKTVEALKYDVIQKVLDRSQKIHSITHDPEQHMKTREEM